MDLNSVPNSDILSVLEAKPICGVIGGPPCQGFSQIGPNDPQDPRNNLLVRFFEIVASLRPLFFVMENVPMAGHSKHGPLLEDALNAIPPVYDVISDLYLDAYDFGAATMRPRLFVLGWHPMYVEAASPVEFLSSQAGNRFNVVDAIADLPRPRQVSEQTGLPYRTDANVSQYAEKMRLPPPCGLGNDTARYCYTNGLVTGNSMTRHSPAVVNRFRQVDPGRSDSVSRYPRLRWDRPSPVLRAGTGKDRGSFQAARPIHPDDPRVISVREAARLQGFPDWFQFPATKWHSHRMIGNSVSPPLAKAILEVFYSRVEV